MNVNLEKTEVMVSGVITKNGMSISKQYPCGVCSLRVKVNPALCLQCGKLIHSRCPIVKRVTPKISRNFGCRKCERNIGEAVEQEEKLCDAVETERELTYLGNRVSAGVGCEAAVTAKTRCGCVNPRDCGEFLCVRRFSLKLIGALYKRYIRFALLKGSEAWRLKDSEMGILRNTETSTEREMCGLQLKERKKVRI